MADLERLVDFERAVAPRAAFAGLHGAQVGELPVAEEVALHVDAPHVEAVLVRARDHVPAIGDRRIDEDRRPGEGDGAERAGVRPHQPGDLLRVGGADLRRACGGLELRLVELLVAADHGDDRLPVGHVDQRLQLPPRPDAVRLALQRLDRHDARRRELLELGWPRLIALGRKPGRRGLGVGGVPALRARGDEVLPGVCLHHELGGLRAAHRARVGLDRDEVEATAAEDPLVRLPLVLVRLVEPGAVNVEGVGVLHRELADPEQAGLGARLVAELGLDLVPDLGQLPVAAQLVAGDGGEDLLVRHPEAVVGPLPVLQPEHVAAHHLPPSALLPAIRSCGAPAAT